MNKLRFKAWDNIDYMSKPFSLMDMRKGKIECTDEVTILQYSGFQDSEGTDIYEGDIVYVAGFSHGAKVLVHPAYGSEFEDITGTYRTMIIAYSENDIGKILGNIYQNPELFI